MKEKWNDNLFLNVPQKSCLTSNRYLYCLIFLKYITWNLQKELEEYLHYFHCFNLGINENVSADFEILMKILYLRNVDLDIDVHLVGISRKDKNDSLCPLYCLMRSNPYGQSFLPTGKKRKVSK